MYGRPNTANSFFFFLKYCFTNGIRLIITTHYLSNYSNDYKLSSHLLRGFATDRLPSADTVPDFQGQKKQGLWYMASEARCILNCGMCRREPNVRHTVYD